jgi:pimeloyl-ACP methyl ester carboxylesterase
MTSSGYITINKQKVHCLRIGKGKKLLLAFHGYNNSADLFAPFAEYIKEEYTVISIDLPHHGKTEWEAPLQMQVKDLMAMVWLLKKEMGVEKVSLMGYSMGGRMCLKIVEMMPDDIEKVLLAAPDGLSFNAFYYFLTRTMPGKALFNHFLETPQFYFPIMNAIRRVGLVSDARHKFAMQHIQTGESRKFLQNVWPSTCRIIPANSRVRILVNKYKISVHIFMGAYDKVIPPAMGKRFAGGIKTAELHIVNKGHRVMDADTMPQMAQCLLS